MSLSKILKDSTLLVGEIGLKATSIPVALRTAGAKGNILEKSIEGYKGLPELKDIPIDVYQMVSNCKQLYNDMNNIPFMELYEKYKDSFKENFIEQFNTGFQYINNVADNFNFFENYEQSIETITAMALSASLLYGSGKILKFIRQKGQGSFLDKQERKLGKKIFNL